MDKDDSIKGQFKRVLSVLVPDSKVIKNAISLLTLLSILGSVMTLVCSSYVAERFSKYYGIQGNNLNILTTAKDMVVALAPFVLMLFLAWFVFSCLLLSLSGVFSVRDRALASAIGLLLFLWFSTFYSSWLVGYQIVDPSNEFSLIIFYGLLILPFGFMVALIIPQKFRAITFVVNVAVFFGVLILCLAFFFESISKLRTTADPLVIKSYEIVNIDDISFATIYTSNESKIVMKCDIDYDENLLTLYYGKYRYIQCEDYEYDYHTFDYVICDPTAE